MMRYLGIMMLAFVALWANQKTMKYEPNITCKSCHQQIYEEYEASMHQNAASFEDPIHGAVWDKHPQNLKKKQYGCGKCHTPAASDLDAMLAPGKSAMPDANNTTHQEGIACAYCHRIESIELHQKSNTNVIASEQHRYFGTRKSEGSPFHKVVSDGNEHLKNGNVCIGCHSHKMNKHGLNVCSTNIENEMDSANCVSCHMPQAEGSVSHMTQRKSHAFHGFAGTHLHQEMLAQYIDINLTQRTDGFSLHIHNKASHALMLHPLRMLKLTVTLSRNDKQSALKEQTFARVIGKDGKPAMPWVADTEIENSMIQHHENRQIDYDVALQKGDALEVTLGYYLVNPKVLPALKLESYDTAKKFNVLKRAKFEVK